MYTCNITGKKFDIKESDKHREGALFEGYNSRFRAICYVFTKMLFNEVRILVDCEPCKLLKGIGMSDSAWADILQDKYNYVNTFYHQSPYLDIYNEEHLKQYSDLDFIISSDVFEHVDPYPGLQTAFNNMAKMLKPGGFIIFSVPFGIGNHVHKEHFPNLFKYTIKRDGDNWILENTTIDGKYEKFTDLVFHGGPGNVLEMRVFSKDSVTSFLKNAGFKDITFYKPDLVMKNRYGIFWENDCSLVISAVKQ